MKSFPLRKLMLAHSSMSFTTVVELSHPGILNSLLDLLDWKEVVLKDVVCLGETTTT